MTIYFQPVQDVQISTQSSRSQYQYTLTGTDAAEVTLWANKLVAEMRRDPLFRDVSSEAQEGGLRAALDINRQRAGQLGVSLQAINDTLNDAFAQRQISTIYGQANQYRVVLEALPMYQRDPSILSKLYVPGVRQCRQPGRQVPISAVATLTRTTAPLAISHQAQFPAVSLSFNLAPGEALGDAVEAVKAIETRIGMPGSIVGVYAGDAAEFSKSLAGQPWLILAAIVTIYIVLGVLYESYIHPITILSTLPSAGVGAILALMLFGQDLSVIGLIGIILLMGIVKKNAIMMIDFALEAERHQGMSANEAIVQACLLRFRPIMMTTLAALFGALPLAVESGTGAELRFPLGISIIGGLLLSQLLTLYTTPVIYLALDRLNRKIEKAVPEPGPHWRRRSPAPPRGCSNGIDLGALHPQAGRHHAAGDRALSGRLRRLCIPAGLGGAQRRFSDDPGFRLASGRRPLGDGVDRCGAAGAAVGADLGDRPDHLDQFARHHQHPAAVRDRPQHRPRRARRAGRDQCVAGGFAERPAVAAKIPQSQSRRGARVRAGADFEDADDERDV